MKAKIFSTALIIIITVTSSFGYAANSNFPVIKEVAITAAFQKIVVDKNFHIVLMQNPERSFITISGDEKNVQNVEMNIAGDQLLITSKKNANTENIVIYVPVKNLSLLQLATGASVSGDGALKFDDLKVEVNNESQVNLRVIGKITVQPAYGCELVFEKNERSKISAGQNF